MSSPRVYLAGPDVFERDAAQRFTELTRIAHALGLAPVVPMDGWGNADVTGHPGEPRFAQARRIYAANVERLNRADGVVANLRDFRGSEPDSGTVFEVGYAVARGIAVVGYGMPDAEYATKVGRYVPTLRSGGKLTERGTGCEVEDFGQRLNLMLACSITIASDAAAALKTIAGLLR